MRDEVAPKSMTCPIGGDVFNQDSVMNDPVPKPQRTEPRQVRVFISSTFYDMQAERDALVKRVFPELRRRCRGLQVEFVGVDLRWGITEEQAARGEVLPVCFAEIEKCRPYFVGLLGDRYGSSLPRIPEAIMERHPWLERFRQRSATELEIRHAVLEGGRPAVRAMFYFRRSGKVEHGGKAKIKAADAGENPERLLEGLKEEIRRGGFPVREDYAEVGTLENWLLEELWQAIREDFPEVPALSPLEQQRREQVAFAGSRTRNYAARDGDFERLDRAGRGADTCLMVTGEAGIGKSALLANWMERFRKEHPEIPVVAHFTGASQEAGEPVAMLRRLTEELSALAGAAAEPPAQWHALASAFGGQLAAAAAKGPLVLLLDGLDQLAETHNAPDMGWLPRFLPENVRLVLSALEGRALAAWTERGWPVMTLNPLDTDQRRRLIAGYLARHGRSLGAAMVDGIVGDERSANPLYLTVLMEELMVFGYYDRLGERVGHYLRARNTVEMYDLMLERIEGDCDGARPGLTREALSLLWAARRGLGEEEIRECLGSRESPLPMAYWSPLFLALGEVRRSLGKYGPARADYEAGLARVEKALGRDHAHTATIRSNYAGLLLEMADFDAAERLYREAFEDTTRALGPNHPHAAHILSNLASTLVHAGRPAEAEPLHQRAVRILTESIGADNPYTLTAKANLAHVLSALGRATEAEALTHEILVQRERIHGPGHPEVASTRESLARLLAGRCKYAEAEALYLEALPVLETFYGTEHRLTADCMTALAQLYHNQGKHAEAEPYYRRSLEVFDRLLGAHHVRTVAARMSLGNLLSQRGALDESAAVCGAAVQALEESGQTGHFLYAQCLNACGITLRKQGRLDEAEDVLGRAIKAYEASQGQDHAATGIGLKAMADLRVDQGRLAEAEQLMERSLAILEQALGPEHPNTLAIAKRPLEELRSRIMAQGS